MRSFSFRIWILLGAAGALACGSEPSPVATACNTVSYRGESYNLSNGSGCFRGLASATVEISGSGRPSACFHLTCTGGCIATVNSCN